MYGDTGWYLLVPGQYNMVPVVPWLYSVSLKPLCLYILQKVEIWTGVTDAWLTDWLTDSQTLKDRATQLLIKYQSGALLTHSITLKVINAQYCIAKSFFKIKVAPNFRDAVFDWNPKISFFCKRIVLCSPCLTLRWLCLNWEKLKILWQPFPNYFLSDKMTTFPRGRELHL